METSEKERLRQLAKEILKIPKEIRLTGKDGFIHLPAVPDLFYINEAVVWIMHACKPDRKNLIRSGDYDYDYTLESKGYSRIKQLPGDIGTLGTGRYIIENSGRMTSVEIYKGLNEDQIFKPNLELNEYLDYSFSHQRFLYRMLNRLYNHSGIFISVLAARLGVPIKTTDEFYRIALHCLSVVQTALQNRELQGNFRIPELYGLRDHGVLMSYSLNEVFQFENEEWGLLYTYRFSKTTSYHFLNALKVFLSLLTKRYESLVISEGQKSSHLPDSNEKVVDRVTAMLKTIDQKSTQRENLSEKNMDDKLATNFEKMKREVVKVSKSREKKILDSMDHLARLIEQSATEKEDNSLIRKPETTTDKTNLILELLAIPRKESYENYNEADVISTMILFKAFSENGVFTPKLLKYQLGIAYHILTGNSYLSFEKRFPMKEINTDVLKKLYNSPTSKKKAIAALDKLIKTLQSNIIPYLEKLR